MINLTFNYVAISINAVSAVIGKSPGTPAVLLALMELSNRTCNVLFIQ